MNTAFFILAAGICIAKVSSLPAETVVAEVTETTTEQDIEVKPEPTSEPEPSSEPEPEQEPEQEPEGEPGDYKHDHAEPISEAEPSAEGEPGESPNIAWSQDKALITLTVFITENEPEGEPEGNKKRSELNLSDCKIKFTDFVISATRQVQNKLDNPSHWSFWLPSSYSGSKSQLNCDFYR